MTYTGCKQLSLETSVEKQTLQLCLCVCVCVKCSKFRMAGGKVTNDEEHKHPVLSFEPHNEYELFRGF